MSRLRLLGVDERVGRPSERWMRIVQITYDSDRLDYICDYTTHVENLQCSHGCQWDCTGTTQTPL